MSRASVEVHAFCRELLKQTMKEVRQHFTAEEIKGAWVYDAGGRKEYEFHGANKEYFHGLDADCTWSAKASGWSKMLAQKTQAVAEHFYYQDGDVCLYCRCHKGSPEASKPCLSTVRVEPDVYEGSR